MMLGKLTPSLRKRQRSSSGISRKGGTASSMEKCQKTSSDHLYARAHCLHELYWKFEHITLVNDAISRNYVLKSWTLRYKYPLLDQLFLLINFFSKMGRTI